MLWTFRISEMRFKHPAKLTIVIHKDKIDQINLLDIKSARNGVRHNGPELNTRPRRNRRAW